MEWTFENILELMKQFDQSEINEFRWKDGEGSLVLRKGYEPKPVAEERPLPPMPHPDHFFGPHSGMMPPQNPAGMPAMSNGAVGMGMPGSAQQIDGFAAVVGAGTVQQGDGDLPQIDGQKGVASAGPRNGTAVKAPLAGVFYRAPKPGEKPYAEVGQAVKKGDVIGLIEAMKMISEIPAPCDGIVKSIDKEDAEFAAFDSTLLVIEENGNV